MAYPASCIVCIDEKVGQDIEDLELSVKPYYGCKNPCIMLVGLNPTLTKNKAQAVFVVAKRYPVFK
ncbi:MAG: hypothetical protein ABSB79_15620 [Syntrophales bacterium]|jgi:hypothetical protein